MSDVKLSYKHAFCLDRSLHLFLIHCPLFLLAFSKSYHFKCLHQKHWFVFASSFVAASVLNMNVYFYFFAVLFSYKCQRTCGFCCLSLSEPFPRVHTALRSALRTLWFWLTPPSPPLLSIPLLRVYVSGERSGNQSRIVYLRHQETNVSILALNLTDCSRYNTP
ncbi:unnamed protein product [Arctogadus glacialis]